MNPLSPNCTQAEALKRIAIAFEPDVTIEHDGLYHATRIETHNGTGIVWLNKTRERYQRPLTGLSIDALCNDWPGVTFETVETTNH